jgi:thiamine-monophosphate kinase
LNKENYFIKQISNNSFNGDDGAVVNDVLSNDEKYIYSSDGFFQNVHFKTSWMTLKQIATKSMLINISDAISMNAIPKYALITIAIPSTYNKNDLKILAKAFKKISKKYNIEIIGGDTLSNVKLDISITIISISNNPIYRSGTNINDLVCYTGTLGTCKKDLEKLFANKKISRKSKFLKPKLRDKFFYEISPYVNSALDISDGLFFELERLSKKNNVGFKFFKSINSSVGCSGEEYEMLFTINSKYKKQVRQIAKKHKLKLNIFAKSTKGKYKNRCKGHHF